MGEKSKILIIGGTGYMGKFLVKESAKSGHPTFVLVRDQTVSNSEKSALFESFVSSGATLLNFGGGNKESGCGDFHCGILQISDQAKIIAAIKECGNVKRFFPSEFGTDVDRVYPTEPAGQFFRDKANIRRALEAERIPYTFVVCYGFAGYFLPNLGNFELKYPPRDKVTVLGYGDHKRVTVAEEDIAAYTIKSVDDPRTLNKSLKIRPPDNILSFNEIVSLWEKKIGHNLEKIYVSEDRIL